MAGNEVETDQAKASSPPRRRPSRRLVAASLVTLVLIAGAAVAVRAIWSPGYEGHPPPPLDRDNAPTGSGPTGWYLPDPAADGWQLRSVRVVDPGPSTRVREPGTDALVPCACESLTFTADDGRAIVATMQPGSDTSVVLGQYPKGALVTEPAKVDWVHGVLAHPRGQADQGDGALRLLVVSDGSRVLQLFGQRQDLATLRAMAVDWIRNMVRPLWQDLSTPKGWTLVSMGGTAWGQHQPFLRVEVTSPIGPLTYDLVAPGSRPYRPGSVTTVERTGGAVFADQVTGALALSAPGADLVAGPPPNGVSQGEVNKALLGVLGPATATRWDRAVRGSKHPLAADQPSLARAIQVAATGVPWADNTSVDRKGAGHNVEGLELSMHLATTRVVAGTPVAAVVQVRNTTRRPIDLDECNNQGLLAGLVPATDQGARIISPQYIDCYTWPELSIPPGATLPYAIYSGLSTVDVRPGRLHAAAQISGVRGGLRVVDPRPVVVEASTCPPLPPGLNEVQQWASVSATEAKEIASRRGLTFQSRYPGDDPGPVDCSRVTAYQVRGASGFDAMLRG